jgi:hypothetical protein
MKPHNNLRTSTFGTRCKSQNRPAASKALRGLIKPRMPSCQLGDFWSFGAWFGFAPKVGRANSRFANSLRRRAIDFRLTCGAKVLLRLGDISSVGSPNASRHSSTRSVPTAFKLRTRDSELRTCPNFARRNFTTQSPHHKKTSPFPILACHLKCRDSLRQPTIERI